MIMVTHDPKAAAFGSRTIHLEKGRMSGILMSIGTFIFKNALRNKRRATLSILSVAVSLFLLVRCWWRCGKSRCRRRTSGAALRVAVRNKISMANPLPARQLPIIEQIPGVEAVTPFTWFGGKYKRRGEMTFAQFAMDQEAAPAFSARPKCRAELPGDSRNQGCLHPRQNHGGQIQA